MKAVRIHEYGDLGVMRYEDAPTPEPRPGEVLIRVRAAALNWADVLDRQGRYGKRTDFPRPLGLEVAGTIEQVGPEVTDLRAGQNVFGMVRTGAYAEYAAGHPSVLFPLPDNLSFAEGAGAGIVYLTAWHALITKSNLQAGQRVLVHAVGSGVGTAALQIAKARGTTVIATAGSDEKLKRARELGADHVINYSTTPDFAPEVKRLTDGKGVNVVIEGVGKATFAGSLASLGLNGHLAVIGTPSGSDIAFDLSALLGQNITMFGYTLRSLNALGPTLQTFRREALPLFASGQLRPIVDRTLPLERAADAHTALSDRAAFGKVVLEM
ncbi:MAG TPA: NAD(P)H-quinone oxidoreductase [Dehalococcoidia bacterium]|nr:NAD(P)H-quinone oxidoreductase [Dehalococcoidia bacterium]